MELSSLSQNDLIDVETKLGYCHVGYIAGKLQGLKAIRALVQSWGASFQQHDSGWLIFRFAREKDRQRILAGGPYFVYGRSLVLKNMLNCFEFKEDDINLTPVWAILPSLPLKCWHPNALGKISSKLGTPIAMDSLTMKMEKQPVVYEFTPKFCTECNIFGHLKDSCQGTHPPVVVTTTTPAATIKSVALKKVQPAEWTLVQRRHKSDQKHQHNGPQLAAGKSKPTMGVQ
ncbi:hypothetical protein Salat_1124700 [Sesamum alatum]|uniref:DUF4283 domain-containing protein n=1 Tax=Sesamum alatum TaxID=300844 RepID=A0AAE1YE85_9LAMI|nr:hypothetical protein Salat_1124700 [Sesamum alatum]